MSEEKSWQWLFKSSEEFQKEVTDELNAQSDQNLTTNENWLFE